MSNYGVSVLITVLVTSLVAFYLLYKAKELNLGIVISISIGSIILGFTFSPVFKETMKLLSEYINIHPKLAFVVSVMVLLIIFLIFILIVSFVISFCIPKKLASIDCCIIVDRLITKIKGGNNIKNMLTALLRKIVAKMQEIVKNVYKPLNKLKKPVDTNQIIDTMGIEKNENVVPTEKSNNNSNNVDFANLIGFMEPSKDVAYETQDISKDIDINDSSYDNLAAAACEEIAEIDVVENEVPEAKAVEIDVVESETPETEAIDIDVVENEIPEAEAVEIDVVESKIPESEAVEIDVLESKTPEAEAVDKDAVQIKLPQVETARKLPDGVNAAESLILKAFECKNANKKEDAIEYYIEALKHGPNNDMIFWIVLDVCALYKQLGLSELAKSILEGLVSKYGEAIQPEVKMEIMKHL